MPGRFREIRETDEDEIEDRKEVKENPEKRQKESGKWPSLEWYSRYDSFVKAVEQDLLENPLTEEEKQEIEENIDRRRGKPKPCPAATEPGGI
ncbi:MAG: hypothetical protein ACFFCO_02535 [Promethearchaeota archaeon]